MTHETPRATAESMGEGVLAPDARVIMGAAAVVEASQPHPVGVAAAGAAVDEAASPLGRLIRMVYPSGTSTRALAMRGSVWTVVMFGAGQVVGLLTNIGLAAVLATSAFGVMLLVKVVIQGLKMFSDIGIGPSIIQNERGDDPVFLNTAWTMQIIRGFALWIGAIALAWPAAYFYGNPLLAPLLIVTGVSAVIAGFHSPALFSLNRRLHLGRFHALNFITLIISNAVMLILAWTTHSVWSLVIGGIVSTLILLVLSHRAIPQPRARIMWDGESGRQLLRFGKWIFVSTMITFLAAQADKLMLGKLLTLDMLGVYSIALTLAMFPGSVAGQLAVSVLYPVLSTHVRTDAGLLGPKVLQARRLILPVGILSTLGVITGAPVLFGFIYPPAFADAGWIAQLLAVPMWFFMLQLSADRAVLAAGDSRSLAASNVWKLIVTVGASLAGYWLLGLPGFIVGMTAGGLAGHVCIQVALARLGVNIVWQDIWYTAVLLVTGAAAAMIPRALSGVPWMQTPDLLPLLVVAGAVLAPMTAWVGRMVWREVLRP